MSENDQKLIHYVYKTTCSINGKIYIGKHSTTNLDDGYIGSGTLFKLATKQFGIGAFQKEVLQYFDTSEEAYKYEGKLVDRKFVLRPDTYNLSLGGNCLYRPFVNPDIFNKKAAGISEQLLFTLKKYNSELLKLKKQVQRILAKSKSRANALYEAQKLVRKVLGGRDVIDTTKVGKNYEIQHYSIRCTEYGLEAHESYKIILDRKPRYKTNSDFIQAMTLFDKEGSEE